MPRLTIKRMVLFAIFVSLVFLPLGCLYVQHEVGDSGLDSALAWTGISRYPACAENIEHSTLGGSFSREIIVEFGCSETDLKQWIAEEDAFATATQTETELGVIYSLTPSEGAQFAEVTADWESEQITIRTYWS